MRNFTLRGGKDANNLINLTPPDYSYLTEFTGFEPVKADLMSQQIYNRDGAVFQSSRGQIRNIVLTVYLFRDVELNRQIILNAFQPGEKCYLRYHSNFIDRGGRWIYGYVESVELNQFEQPQKAKHVIQIAITCFNPYFGGLITAFETEGFSIDIDYPGSAPSGLSLTFKNSGVSSITFDVNGEQHLTLDFTRNPVSADDEINFDTNNHTLRIKRSGSSSYEDAINLWTSGSNWIYLKQGNNRLSWTNGAWNVRGNVTYYYYSIYD